jgi:hypothetical protein
MKSSVSPLPSPHAQNTRALGAHGRHALRGGAFGTGSANPAVINIAVQISRNPLSDFCRLKAAIGRPSGGLTRRPHRVASRTSRRMKERGAGGVDAQYGLNGKT